MRRSTLIELANQQGLSDKVKKLEEYKTKDMNQAFLIFEIIHFVL